MTQNRDTDYAMCTCGHIPCKVHHECPDLTKLREAYNEFETALAFGMEGLRTMDLYKAVKELLEQEGK